MKKVQRYIKVVFVLLLAMTSLGIQTNNNVLAEEGLGNEDIVITLDQSYNKETNTEDIKFGIQVKTEGTKILEVLDSESNAQLNDNNNYNYTVNANGDYEYTIKYQSSNNEQKEYKFAVEVNSIQVENEITAIQPLMEVSNQKVKVDIPTYDETAGWQATNNAKVMYVNVKFDPNSSNKKLDITLPMGMRYTNYRILDPISGSNLESELDGTTKDMVTKTTRPSVKVGDSTYGTLSYEFGQGAESITIELSIAVDASMVTKDTIITDGIKVKAEENNQSIGSIVKDINAKRVEVKPHFYISDSNVLVSENQESIELTEYRFYSNFTVNNAYYSDITLTYYYPKEFKYVRMDGLPSGHSSPVINESEGSVSINYKNYVINYAIYPRIIVSGEGVTEGIYTASSIPKVEAYNFQGDSLVQNVDAYPDRQVKITVVSKVDNKLSLEGLDGYFYDSQEDYYSNGPMFYLSNDNVSEKTNQVYEVTVDTNYKVVGVNIPYDYSKNKSGIDVYYKTNKNNSKWIKADKNNIVFEKKYGTNAYTATITKSSLQLEDDEYITNVKGYIGTISKGFRVNHQGAKFGTDSTPSVSGRLTEGVDSANISVKTYAEAVGTVEAGTEVSATNKVYRDSSGKTTVGRTLKSTTLIAGETTTQEIDLGIESYRYGEHTALNNPTIYLRVPNGITYSNFKVRSLINDKYQNVSYELSEPYVSAISGETFIKLKVNGNFGARYGNTADLKKLIVNFDVTANIQINTLNLNWNEYLFIQDSVFSEITASNNETNRPGAILDILDVNNNGNVTEKITPIDNKTFTVNSKTGLLIDTFITPNGDSKKDPYNGNEETAVAFKPETEATYSVDMFNNTKEDLSEIRVYLPIPKEGNNFGTNFQESAFSWNMKLKGNPTIKVYDVNGNDVTSSRKDAYKVEYSSNATNESNYVGATYGNSITSSTSMIRITNTEDLPNGEQVVLEFPYEVDETDASITAKPEKLGSVNDFSPYYYFKSTNTSGYLSGTKVGAILSIGTIEGVVFLDNNGNGIYDSGDGLSFNGGTVKLFATDNTTGTPDATATIGSNGKYKFTGLDIKNYTLDFSDIAGQFQKFSVTSEEENGSKVDYLGANAGKVQNVNTALRSSKSVYAGIINYQAPTITSESDLYFKRGSIVPDLFLRTLANVRTTGYFTDAVQFDQRAVNFSEEGMYQVNLSVSDAYGGTATTTFNVHVMDTINANGFIIPLDDVADADFVLLSGANAVNITMPTNIVATGVRLEGRKPTSAGLHEVTFKADTTGETIKVNVLVYSGTIVNNEVIEADNFTVTLKNLKDADMKTLANAKAYDVSDPADVKEVTVQTVSAKPTTVGLHPITFATAKGAQREVTAIVSDNAPNDKKEVVIAYDFQVKLSDVKDADFVALAKAKGYNVADVNDPKEVAVTLKSAKPTKAGVHKVRFETANGAFAEVEVIVSNEDPKEVETDLLEVVTAQDFTVALKDLTTADFVVLAKAKGYEYPKDNVDNKKEIAVKLVGSKPTTAGKHTVRFETDKGAYAEVEVVVYSGTVANNEVINASNFTTTLANLKTADMKDLAKAKGYDISDPNNIKEIEVTTETAKPTRVGEYEITFKTAGGASKTVTAIISDNAPNDKNEVVIAYDFQVKLSDVKTADFVKLAKVKGYDVTDIDNPKEMAVTLKSTKPTTVGVHKVRFETANRAFAEVEVIVSNNDPEEVETDKLEVVTARDFVVALDDVADADFVKLAKAKGYEYPKDNEDNKKEITVTRIGKKPKAAGVHTVRFETDNGAFAEVEVLVYDGVVTNNEVINASNFTTTLTNLKTADMKKLAKAKAYDISDPSVIKEIEVITETAKPTKVGKYDITFKTANGASRTVTAIVSDNAPNDKNEVVIAEGFEIAVGDVANADFVKLAKAKGYDLTDINNPKEVAVTLKSKKPTTIGTHKVRFETATGAYTEVNVKVYSSSGGDEDEEKIYANDFSYGISQGTLSEAKAKELASISAYGDDGSKLNLSQVSVNSKQLEAINDVIGTNVNEDTKYDLTFTTPKGISTTITVTLYDTGNEKDEENVYGNNFTYKITQGEITEPKAKELANVYARTADGTVIDLKNVTVKKNELDAINKAITDKSISGNPYKLTFTTSSGSSVTVDVTLQQGEIKIVDDFREDDGIVVIYRTGSTGEKAPSYLPNGYSPTYDLKLQVGGKDMSEAELAKVTWTTEEAGSFPSVLTYVETKDGSATITAKKSGVVKLVANYEGVTDSIYVVIPGDVDRNGSVNVVDAGRVQGYIKTKKKSDLGKDDEFTFLLADMNGDGLYNPVDAGIMQNMSKKLLKPSN